MHGCMQPVDNAHPNLSADRPPFHTPGGAITLVIINVGEVEEGQETEEQTGMPEKGHRIMSRCCDSVWEG